LLASEESHVCVAARHLRQQPGPEKIRLAALTGASWDAASAPGGRGNRRSSASRTGRSRRRWTGPSAVVQACRVQSVRSLGTLHAQIKPLRERRRGIGGNAADV